MKTQHIAVLALALITSIFSVRAQDQDLFHDEVIESLTHVLDTLDRDTKLYSRMHGELAEIAKEFDESAETRRQVQCCVGYKFDSLNDKYSAREAELLAIIADKDQQIADLQDKYDSLEADAASESEELSRMLHIVTLQLTESRDIEIQTDVTAEELSELIAQIQDAYAAMEEQRINFLLKLEVLADKAYGHFEIEAIENTVFAERICGNLFCPDIDVQSVQGSDKGNTLALCLDYWDACLPE